MKSNSSFGKPAVHLSKTCFLQKSLRMPDMILPLPPHLLDELHSTLEPHCEPLLLALLDLGLLGRRAIVEVIGHEMDREVRESRADGEEEGVEVVTRSRRESCLVVRQAFAESVFASLSLFLLDEDVAGEGGDVEE